MEQVQIQVDEVTHEPVISSIDLAQGLGIEHASLMKTIRDHAAVIEKTFGACRFKIDAEYQAATGIVRYQLAYLNEAQALFIGSLSRNSAQVIAFKANLVGAFVIARRQLTSPRVDSYLIEDPILRAQRWIEEQQERKAAAEPVAQLAAPAEIATSSVEPVPTTYTTTEIAKELGMSAVALNRKLNDLGVQCFYDGRWILYQHYRTHGFTLVRKHTHTDRSGKQHVTQNTVWTEAGRDFVLRTIRQKAGKLQSTPMLNFNPVAIA